MYTKFNCSGIWENLTTNKNINNLRKHLGDNFKFYDQKIVLTKNDFIDELKIINHEIIIKNCKSIFTDESKDHIYSYGLCEIIQEIFNIEVVDKYDFIAIFKRTNDIFKIELIQISKLP